MCTFVPRTKNIDNPLYTPMNRQVLFNKDQETYVDFARRVKLSCQEKVEQGWTAAQAAKRFDPQYTNSRNYTVRYNIKHITNNKGNTIFSLIRRSVRMPPCVAASETTRGLPKCAPRNLGKDFNVYQNFCHRGENNRCVRRLSKASETKSSGKLKNDRKANRISMSKRSWSSMVSGDWLKFKNNSREGQPLSNFHKGPVKVNGRMYNGGEQAFHGEKYQLIAESEKDSTERQRLLEHASKFESAEDPTLNGNDAKKMGGKNGYKLTPEQLAAWDNGGAENVQLQICRYKFRHDPIVRETLVSSMKRPLLHQDNRAHKGTIWGGKIDKEGNQIGQNKLGRVWVTVRYEELFDKN